MKNEIGLINTDDHTLHEETNRSVEMLCEFVFFFFAINMIVMSTQFQYKQIHTKQPGYLLIELPETKLIMY